jgi:hypothetical protein
MRFPYMLASVKTPIPSLGGALIRPRPVVALRVIGPTGSQLMDGLVDTGSDDTVFEQWVAALIGVDMTRAVPRDIGLVGRVQPVRVHYVPVRLRITDGSPEAYEWPAVVGFTPTKLRYPLFGYAGFLQFFNSEFRGDNRELILTPNATLPGSPTP